MKNFHVLGIMSGTSLDGIDIAEIYFNYSDKWKFELGCCKTIPYSTAWVQRLKTAFTFSKEELAKLDVEYTSYLASIIKTFITQNNIVKLDAVCSHGHTILHDPKNQYTLQIGNLPTIAKLIKQKVVCDFRVQDVDLGGQGAPLVPIGDELLFPEYDFCLNLGGFANISFKQNGKRIAFDNCPVNTVLNAYAQKLGTAYDNNGNFARQGILNPELLYKLNNLSYYKKSPPKSLGIEWVETTISSILNQFNALNPKDILHTFSTHIAAIIAQDINLYTPTTTTSKLLITGGGAYNSFLIDKLNELTTLSIEIPEPNIIEFKEALIFGLLGVLKLKNHINILASVTGSTKDHSSGKVFLY